MSAVWLALLLDALLTYRLARLITADTITRGARERFVLWTYDRKADGLAVRSGASVPGDVDDFTHADPEAPKLATLVTCRWCTGAWVAAGIVAARWGLTPDWPLDGWWWPAAWWGALASAAALVAGLEQD